MPEAPYAPFDDPSAPPLRGTLAGALARGLRQRCPACGEGRLYRRYLKPVTACAACAEPLGHIRADDMPAYLVIVIVGHILVPAALLAEKLLQPPVWLHMTVWIPAILLLTALLLPPVKGAAVGLMWRLRLSGDERQGHTADDWPA